MRKEGCHCDDISVNTDKSRSSQYPMIEVTDALDIIIKQIQLHNPQNNIISVPLYNSLHCTVANDVVSPIELPPFRASIMDGYGIYIDTDTTQVSATYNVVGSITAGITDLQNIVLLPNECVYITTGSIVPDYINCVIMIESTSVVGETEKTIYISSSVTPNMNIRSIGCDLKQNDTVIQRHTTISSVDIGLLASVGYTYVDIFKQPVVGVFSSGNELIDIAINSDIDNRYRLKPGEIYDSNRLMLLSSINESYATPYDMGIVKDNESDLTTLINRALQQPIDILITTGGVSMGNLDLIKPLLLKLGTIHFGRLNMKPGKPCTFATIQRKNTNTRPLYIFALPGNPVSALVCYNLLVSPTIKLMNGQSNDVDKYNHGSIWIKCKLTQSLKRDPVRPEYHRCIIQYNTDTNEYIALSTGNQLSSRLMSLKSANGLLLIQSGNDIIQSGSLCDVLVIGDIQPYKQSDVNNLSIIQPSNHHLHNVQQSQSTALQQQPPTTTTTDKFTINTAIITVSDSVSQGKSTDRSGPEMCQLLLSTNDSLKSAQYNIMKQIVVPDEADQIKQQLIALCDPSSNIHLLLTTGGTGFSPRDITPDITSSVLHRYASGIVTAMITHSLQHTSMAALSRLTAGTRYNTIIVNLPGSPKAIQQLIPMLATILPHAVKLQCYGHDRHNVK